MANEKATIDIEVKTKEAVNGLKELRNELKAAKAQALNGDGAAAKKVAELTDKFDDLKDSVKTLQGSGIEKASSSLGLLKDGFKNLDFDKITTGLSGLKTALGATGILLLVQGVTYLIENFDELSQGSGLLGKSLRFVGDIIGGLKDALYELTDALGITNSELDKQGDAIKTNADKATDALANQTAEYDRQIAVAKASGKSAVSLEKAKQQAIIDTNKALIEQTIAYVRNGGILDDEKKKLLTEQLNAIKNAKVQEAIIDIAEDKKISDNRKKASDERKKIRDAEIAESERRNKEFLDSQLKDIEDLKNAKQVERDLRDEQRLADIAIQDEIDRRRLEKAAAEKKQLETDVTNQKAADAAKLASAQQGIMATMAVTDAFFAFKSRSLTKGSKEEEELNKKAFKVNKALQLANATVLGIQSVQGAFTTATASPITTAFPAYPFIQAGLAGVFSAANIAKIAASQYTGGAGGGGGSSASAPTVSIPSPPTISTPQNNVNGTQFDSNGNTIQQTQTTPTITVKAQVVETEITDTQNTIQKIKNQSTF